MPSEFERATAVRPRRDGVFDATVHDGWDIGTNANGGYLMALAARAMSEAVGRAPLSVTAHFLAPGKPGPCTIDVDIARSGRRMATVAATLRSDAGPIVRLLGVFGDQQPGGPTVLELAPPNVPRPEDCVVSKPPIEWGSGFGDRIDARLHPDDAGFPEGRPSGRAQMRGWFSFADQSPVDAVGLVLVADAFAPVVFNRPEFAVGWSPTLELTVHVRAEPVEGPLLVRFSSRVMQSGMFEEDGEIWDAAGTFVAQSRQLALVPRPG